jgi:hypothetical protein
MKWTCRNKYAKHLFIKHWRFNDVKVPTHNETYLKKTLHTVQLTWDNQKKSKDSAFIKLGEEEIVLFDQMSCEATPLFFHKKKVKKLHTVFIIEYLLALATTFFSSSTNLL